MKKRHFLYGILILGAASIAAAAYVVSPVVHPGQSGEAPELGRTGEFAIGTVEEVFVLDGRSSITGTSLLTGNLEPGIRELPVRIWYPAVSNEGKEPEQYVHVMNLPNKEPFEIISRGIAHADSEPTTQEKFPLVIMSHGFGGWSTQFSNLGEHLATKGYVVASINHNDMIAGDVTSALISFGNVLVDRTLDQRQVLAQILANAGEAESGYASIIDREKIGLIGYSMGGYGALSTAGAAYSLDDGPVSRVPGDAKDSLEEASLSDAGIDAVVAFAPWGGQPDNRAWTAQSLANIEIPTLLVSGDQDDIVNFDLGVKWLFENITGADRYLLVFREARHNIVGNEFEVAPDTIFNAIEFLKEPVWRSDRLNAINQHFVTAFLDWKLNGREEMADYLNVPTPDANDGEWPIAFNEQLNGTLAGPEQEQYWRGFQRRWAAGMELHFAAKEANAADVESGDELETD